MTATEKAPEAQEEGRRGPWPPLTGYAGACLACNIEAAIGTEDAPHPIPSEFHTCEAAPSPAPEPASCPRCLAYRNGTDFREAAKLEHTCRAPAPASPSEHGGGDRCEACKGMGRLSGHYEGAKCGTCGGTGQAPGRERR